MVNYKNKKLISDPHNYGGYKQRLGGKDEGLSEKDAHSSGYVNTKINTLQYTYEVPELTKSFLVHENSHQFHQWIQASKLRLCRLFESVCWLNVEFNYS